MAAMRNPLDWLAARLFRKPITYPRVLVKWVPWTGPNKYELDRARAAIKMLPEYSMPFPSLPIPDDAAHYLRDEGFRG